MPVDVVIGGGGLAGLSAAIGLKQIDDALELVVLEKGSEIGAHSTSELTGNGATLLHLQHGLPAGLGAEPNSAM